MDVFEAIHTTRAMRRLDPDRDVSNEDIKKIIVAATKAPSGSNRQPVRCMVVKDAQKRGRLGVVYRRGFDQLSAAYDANPGLVGGYPLVRRSAEYLAEHMGEAPVILIPCAPTSAGVEGSVFPAIQNLMIAARALGLGTTLTTVHRFYEQEVKELLGIPEEFTSFAFIPVGYPLGRWSEAKRRPYEEITYWNTWNAAPPDGTNPINSIGSADSLS